MGIVLAIPLPSPLRRGSGDGSRRRDAHVWLSGRDRHGLEIVAGIAARKGFVMLDLSRGLVPAVIVCCAGCATIMAGGADHVKVATNPPGATVFVDNRARGQTPVVIDLDRQRDQGQFRIELPGFQPVQIARGKHVNGWIFGNILIGGLIGVVIDLVTGNASRFDDDAIAVGLTPSGGGAALPAPTDPTKEGCRQERRRALVEAMKIQDHDERVRKIHAAPVCDPQ